MVNGYKLEEVTSTQWPVTSEEEEDSFLETEPVI